MEKKFKLDSRVAVCNGIGDLITMGTVFQSGKQHCEIDADDNYLYPYFDVFTGRSEGYCYLLTEEEFLARNKETAREELSKMGIEFHRSTEMDPRITPAAVLEFVKSLLK